MTLAVSVIVPVYNPGHYIDDCVASLLRQSMPAEAYEVIFVDDGSTDETPARLDELAAMHPNVRVVHQPNSGWPGRPRNVGIDAAEGEYVFFVDNDDWLADEALERMYAFATANGSDVVVPKMAGIRRGVPRELFRATRPVATLGDTPLVDSMTPHKLFRKAMLDEHGIRFPEGRRRLEDHVFVTAAYFAAEVISVYADAVCYFHIRRDDESNAGYRPIDWPGYFANLREVLDIVVANTEPGRLRDRLLRRWARVEILERLRGRQLLARPPEERAVLVREARAVQQAYLGPGVFAVMPEDARVAAALIADDRPDDLIALAGWEAGLTAHPTLLDLTWRDGAIVVEWSIRYASGSTPLRFHDDAGRALLDLPLSADVRAALPDGVLDTTKRLAIDRLDLVLRGRESYAEHYATTERTDAREPVDGDDGWTPVRSARSTLDPETIAGGGPLPAGLWDVLCRTSCAGITFTVKLGSVRTPSGGLRAGVVGLPARVVTPYWTKAAEPRLAIDAGQTLRRLDREPFGAVPVVRVEPADGTAQRGAVRVRVELVAAVAVEPERPMVRLVPVHRTGPALDVPASLEVDPGPSLVAVVPRTRLSVGSWRPAVRLTSTGRFVRLPVELRVDRAGVEVAGVPEDHGSGTEHDRSARRRLLRLGQALHVVRRAVIRRRVGRHGAS